MMFSGGSECEIRDFECDLWSIKQTWLASPFSTKTPDYWLFTKMPLPSAPNQPIVCNRTLLETRAALQSYTSQVLYIFEKKNVLDIRGDKKNELGSRRVAVHHLKPKILNNKAI